MFVWRVSLFREQVSGVSGVRWRRRSVAKWGARSPRSFQGLKRVRCHEHRERRLPCPFARVTDCQLLNSQSSTPNHECQVLNAKPPNRQTARCHCQTAFHRSHWRFTLGYSLEESCSTKFFGAFGVRVPLEGGCSGLLKSFV